MRTLRPATPLRLAVPAVLSLIAALAGHATAATLTVSNTNDSGSGSLRQAIADANDELTNPGPDTVDATGVTGTITLSTELLVNTDVTILGPAAGTLTLDGSGTTHILSTTGGSSSASNLTFANGIAFKASTGGALTNAGTLTLSNCTFSANSATRGGAIGNSGILTINNCTFSGNDALGDTDVGQGGAIYNTNRLLLNSSTFTDNTAEGVTDSFGDGAAGQGGALFNTATAVLTGGAFSSNSAIGGEALDGFREVGTNGGSGQGGAIYNEATLRLNGTAFAENEVTAQSGSFGFIFPGEAGEAQGGAIYNDVSASITNSTFLANEANSAFSFGFGVSGGGALCNLNQATVSSSTFTGNGSENGGAVLNLGALNVQNSNFSTNIAAIDGGAICSYAPAPTALISNSVFNANSAGFGGGILNDANMMINLCTLSGNGARQGGGVFNFDTLTITRSTINDNTVTQQGGGVWNFALLSITNSTLSANASTGQGGGLYDAGATTLTNATVALNRAYEGGGSFNTNTATGAAGSSIVASNIVSGGSGADVNGSVTSNGFNLIGNGDGSTGFVNGTNGDIVGTAATPVNPRLGGLAANGGTTRTHALLRGSPALDAGNPAGPNIDQRGLLRPRDGNGDGTPGHDIGAFEAQLPLNTAPIAGNDNYSTFQDTSLVINAPGVLSNDSDAQKDALMAAVVAGNDPDKGTLTFRANGSFTYVPKPGVTGSDSFAYSVTDGEFTTAPVTVTITITATYRITGRVSNSAGAGIPNVAIARTGQSAAVLTNSAGYYTLTRVPAGTYTITPSLSGTEFTPAERVVTVTNSDVPNQNFIGNAGFTISGRIAATNGTSLAGIRVTRSGNNSGSGITVVTNSAGYYTFTGVLPGDYSVTPTQTGYGFTPAQRAVTITNANATNQNFVGRAGATLNGRVLRSDGTAIPDTTVTLTDGTNTFTTATNSVGYYQFFGVAPGEYTLFANRAGFTFNPPSRQLTVITSDINNLIFVGRAGATIIGRITLSDGAPLAGVTVNMSNGFTTTTNSAGYFTFRDVPNGDWTLTPSLGGYSFTPASRSLNITGSDLSGQNFVAAAD